MLDLILILLGLSALYCGGMWLFLAVVSIRNRQNLENETFHLGLCFILSVGFLGLLLTNGA